MVVGLEASEEGYERGSGKSEGGKWEDVGRKEGIKEKGSWKKGVKLVGKVQEVGKRKRRKGNNNMGAWWES